METRKTYRPEGFETDVEVKRAAYSRRQIMDCSNYQGCGTKNP
jgi:hypothetical protein